MDNDTDEVKELHYISIEWGDYESMKEQFDNYVIKEADGKVIKKGGKRNGTGISRLLDINRGTARKYMKLAGIL